MQSKITKMRAAESCVFLPFTYKHVVYLDIFSVACKKGKTMKILQLMGTLDRGGVESMIANLIRHGLKTDICLEIPDKGMMEDELETYGCHIYHLTRRSTSMKKHHKELADIAKNYDIIHVHAQNAFLALIEVKVLKKTGVKKVIVHSHNTRDWRSGILGNFLHKAARPFLKDSCIRAACSTEAGEWMFGTDDIHLIPLPIDTEKFRFDPEKRNQIRDEFDDDGKKILLHVGNFRKAKNHIFLIHLIDALEKRYPGKYVLYLVGSGPLYHEIKKEALKLPVQFLGSIDNVPDIMSSADMFLLPSFNEGLPTVALEAQASGLPCLLSDHITKECEITDLIRFEEITDMSGLENIYPWIHDCNWKAKNGRNREEYADEVEMTNGINAVLMRFHRLYKRIDA